MIDYIKMMMSAGVLGYVSLAVSFGFVGLLIYTTVGLVVTFIYHQAKNLTALYRFSVECKADYHPYTNSILNNTCPELAELARLQKKGAKAEMREVLDSMIHTLNTKESDSVKYQLISQLKALR